MRETSVRSREAVAGSDVPELRLGVGRIKNNLASRELAVRDVSLRIHLLTNEEVRNLIAITIVSVVLNDCLCELSHGGSCADRERTEVDVCLCGIARARKDDCRKRTL